MIYIDPPYNTGNDFIYKDDFSDNLKSYLEKTNQIKEGLKLTNNPETAGRFHSDWISFMYPRLWLAKDILTDDGFIFISIDENEVHNLKIILNEIFGEENFRNSIALRRYDKNINRQFMEQGLTSFNTGFEYVLVYSKNSGTKLNPVFRKASEERSTQGYWKGFWNGADRPTMRYKLLGITPEKGQWKWKKDVANEAIKNYEEYLEKFSKQQSLEDYWIKTGKSKKFIKRNPNGKGSNKGVEHWIAPSDSILRNTLWHDVFASKTIKSLDLNFDNPKNHEMIIELMKTCTNEDSIILDFMGGSGTTAHSVIENNFIQNKNQKFILVQIPESNSGENKDQFPKISDITKERIRRVIQQFKDHKKQQKLNSKQNQDLGFKVFKLTKSNYKVWDDVNDEAKLKEQLKLFEDPLVENYKDIDVIYEIIIKEGYSLNSEIKEISAKPNKIYKVTDDEFFFYVTLDKQVKSESMDILKLDENVMFACLDSALDESQKVNLSKSCKLRTI
jgi:adenine-specific DNA-methyltransferase